jgi:hypothetical protein
LNHRALEFAAKEKLEIVIGTAEPRFRNFAGAFLVACGGKNRPNYFQYPPQYKIKNQK